MKNNITFQPLISPSIYCHLLSINNTKILINSGGNESFYTQEILNIINSCDCILITSFDLECINSLFLILNQGFFKPVYMSVPVKEFFLIFHEKEYKNIYDVKYLQPFNVNDVQICAFNAGNSLGASLYKITSNRENIYIGYNINHRKENHLNGVDLKKITDSYVFITNSKYCYKENINHNIRNDQFISLIKNVFNTKSKKLIIYISYTRFHELGIILNNIKDKKIIIFDKFIEKFINKSKNMVEWSNSKLIEENDVYEYSNLERVEYFTKLGVFDICVVLNDDITILDKYNNENLSVLFIDKKIDIKNMPVYEYKGIYEIQEENESEELLSESSDEEIIKHWSEEKHEIRFYDSETNVLDKNSYNMTDNITDKISYNMTNNITDKNDEKRSYNMFDKQNNNITESYNMSDNITENYNKQKYFNKRKYFNDYNSLFQETYKYFYDSENSENFLPKKFFKIQNFLKFPTKKKIRNFDNYGEYVDQFKFQIKLPKLIIKEDTTPVKIYKESKTLFKLGITPKFKILNFNLQGSSDLKNIKVVLQNTESKKILIVEDDFLCSKFMYNNLLCSVKNVQICNKLVNLSSSTNINIFNVSDIINNISKVVKLENMNIFRFIGRKEEKNIKFIKEAEKISACDFNDLRKKIVGVNLKIERIGDSFVVQDKVVIKLENEKILLEGEEGEVYNYMRDLLYENILQL
ncbi:cleavage and polyadenylation specificity factor subunit [Vairimorpha necatrix]|uniref:Cleavage and polyadenylation specificity factor subunit 2 n=1 Tax=Vairimorpha necatrix TaxID=6039 RepID=A0AAX4JCZ6_9MICR